MNPGDRHVDKNRSQENERRKGDALEEQRKTQAVVRTPQRDSEAIEFMPLCQEVEGEIDGNERGAGPPKLGRSRSEAGPTSVRVERHVMRIREGGHFIPDYRGMIWRFVSNSNPLEVGNFTNRRQF